MSGFVSDIWLAACSLDGVNTLEVALMDDSSGVPGSVLEKWTFKDQMVSCGTNNSPLHGIGAGTTEISAGVTYWLVASAPAADEYMFGLWSPTVLLPGTGQKAWKNTIGFGGPWFGPEDGKQGAFRVAVNEAPEEVPVPVDIKPMSCPNPLNIKDKGYLPVAIVGTADLDVSTIDPATIKLEGVSPVSNELKDVATPYSPFIGKVSATDCTTAGPDGIMDLLLKFKVQDVVSALGAVNNGDILVLQLTGSLFDGTPIVGEDVVKIMKK